MPLVSTLGIERARHDWQPQPPHEPWIVVRAPRKLQPTMTIEQRWCRSVGGRVGVGSTSHCTQTPSATPPKVVVIDEQALLVAVSLAVSPVISASIELAE